MLCQRQAYSGRPRKGAWIEISGILLESVIEGVAPARGRGLKYQILDFYSQGPGSPPQGGVD